MRAYGNSREDVNDMENTSFQSQFGPSMLKDDKQPQNVQPLISFRYHPGFFCFFQDYVNKKGWTFYQCYQKVFEGHHEMTKIRKSVEDIMKDRTLDKQQKINQLMYRSQKGKKFAYYLKKQNNQLECHLVSHQDRRIEKIKKLQKQLEKLESIKQSVIKQKKNQFQLKEIQRSLEQQKEIEKLMTEKERRANLVRLVQLEAQQKRLQKERKKHEKTDVLHKGGLTMCEIM